MSKIGKEIKLAPEGKIRLSGPIERDSIVNGPGLRAVVWVQGCHLHCPGCQNPETWSLDDGFIADIDWVKQELSKLKGQTGLTFCGGEPFVQARACKEIAEFAKKELNWDVWSFSGYTYEQIMTEHDEIERDFLETLDALIDGPFIMSKLNLDLKFRGSSNQRILHLKNGKIISQE